MTLANHSPKLYFSKHMARFSSFYKGHITKCFATAHKSSSLSNPFCFPHGLPSDHQCEKNVKMRMLVALLCPTLCNPMECSPPDFSVHGILQARTREWVAIFSSRVSGIEPRSPVLQVDSLPSEPPDLTTKMISIMQHFTSRCPFLPSLLKLKT